MPDPHFARAVETIRRYESAKAPSERNYLDPSYVLALKELSLVADSSPRRPEARRLAAEISRGVIRFQQNLDAQRTVRVERARAEASRRAATERASRADTGMDKDAALRLEQIHPD